MTTGEKIAKLRKENNYTQEQLADLLEVTRQAISRWESDLAFPETEKIIKLGKVFNCSIDYLLKENVDESGKEIEIKVLEVDSSLKSREYNTALLLTYLSFPPLIGVIISWFSIHKCIKNNFKTMLIVSILGFIFSAILTTIMIIGFVYKL